MRIKINENPNVPKLEYGKSYELKLATCEWYYRFKFTRKKNIYYKEINRGCHVSGDIQITKKTLKQLINSSEFTECVVEADYRPDILHALFGDIDYATKIAQLIKNNRYKVYLSRFYDVPSEIDTIEMELETLLNDLCKIDLIINNITEISVKGEFKKCVGISLLNNYKEIHGEPVRSLYIFLN
ncbi:hypothetical protein ACIQZG_22195 [Lysinibacillus sp. NPDC096418]|uniref:hypothetical protein n=1 Tax=Lysinibacillus sp. NPDC096418 TaxID=3364138 RepID=UPI00381047DA